MRRYVSATDTARVIQRYDLDIDRLADIREETEARQVWQDVRADGGSSPTWKWSDAARESGARGMIYRSRSRPNCQHIVLFDWSGALVPAGPPDQWSAPEP